MRARQHGFTLIELSLVLAVIAVLAQGYFLWKQSVLQEGIVTRTVNGLVQIDEALYAYRIDQGVWPTNISELTTYLPNLQNVTDANAGANGVGLPYSIRSQGHGLVIETQLLTEAQARAVGRAFPNSGVIDPDTATVSVGIPLPGLESAHSALMHIDGSRQMTGDLDLGGQDLHRAGDIESDSISNSGVLSTAALSVTGVHNKNDSCSGQQLGLSTEGKLLSCVANQWSEPLYQAASTPPAAESGIVFHGAIMNPIAGYSRDQCDITAELIIIFDGEWNAQWWPHGANAWRLMVWYSTSPPPPQSYPAVQYTLTCTS